MRTIRRDATQPAQRRLRSSRNLRAAPSLRLPIGNQSRREGGGYIQTGLEGEHPASSGTPRALETIGIHLKIALGLSNEVGPPHRY